MDQFYRICHISKRKAKCLLESGVIPCKDSGKQTRRFHIQLENVIKFLERRDAGLLKEDSPVTRTLLGDTRRNRVLATRPSRQR